MGRICLPATVCLSLTLIGVAVVSPLEHPDLESVLAGIEKYDELLLSIEAEITVLLPEKEDFVFTGDGKWGMTGRKRYLAGTMVSPGDGKSGDHYSWKREARFDGTLLTWTGPGDSGETVGVIQKYAPDCTTPYRCRSELTPWRFLGGCLNERDKSLSRFLREEATNLSILEQDGPMVVLGGDCMAFPDRADHQFPRFFKIWIDTGKHYRPVRIEITYVRDDRFETPEPYVTYSDIRLEMHGGLYVPVCGIFTEYDQVPLPTDGYTLGELKEMPEDERMKHVRFEFRPREPVGRRQMVVTSVKVNDGIPAEEFRIDFPQGMKVFDRSDKPISRMDQSNPPERFAIKGR